MLPRSTHLDEAPSENADHSTSEHTRTAEIIAQLDIGSRSSLSSSIKSVTGGLEADHESGLDSPDGLEDGAHHEVIGNSETVTTAIEEDRVDQNEEGESDEDEEMEYEAQRLDTIRKRDALLASLGLGSMTNPLDLPKPTISSTPPKTKTHKSTGRRVKLIPKMIDEPRRSSRVAAAAKQEKTSRNGSGLAELPSDWNDDKMRRGRSVILPQGEKITVPSVRHYADPDPTDDNKRFKRRKVTPGAPLGDGETSTLVEPDDYAIVHPPPKRMKDGTGRLSFGGRWKGVFEPNVTPEEMFLGGSFGGTYYADNYSKVLQSKILAKDDIRELPRTLLDTRLATMEEDSRPYSPSTHLTSSTKDPAVNRFGVSAGQSLQDWEKSGWIWEGDPRGWAQWYVRFWMGRRCPDDERQVQRWLNLAGPKGRFSRTLLKKIANDPGSGGLSAKNTAVEDEEVGTVLRQVCWQWGYQVNEAEWKRKVVNGAVPV